MSQVNYDAARNLFVSHHFSRKNMEEDGTISLYESYQVPEGQEKQWRLEQVDGLLAQLKRCKPETAPAEYAALIASCREYSALFEQEQLSRFYDLLMVKRTVLSADDALSGLCSLSACIEPYVRTAHLSRLEEVNAAVLDWAGLLTGYVSDAAGLDALIDACQARQELFSYQAQMREFKRLNAELSKCGRLDFSRKAKLTRQLMKLRQSINQISGQINSRG